MFVVPVKKGDYCYSQPKKKIHTLHYALKNRDSFENKNHNF